MIQIKMVKNGSRTIIAIDGATEEQDAIVHQIVTAYSCGKDFAERMLEPTEPIPQITSVLPPTVVNDLPSIEELDKMESDVKAYQVARISSGQYAGASPGAALYKGGISALVELFHMACQMENCAEKSAIVAACKNYLKSIRNIVKPMTKDQKAEFMKTAIALYPANSQISSLWGGYKDIESFLANASATEVEHAFEVLIQGLEERGKQ